MADAYGTIVVGFSDDFDGSKDKLCEELNSLYLTNDGAEFVVSDERIWLNSRYTQDPTLFPLQPKTMIVERNSEWLRIPADEVTDAEWEAGAEPEDYEPVPLAIILSQLAKHIKVGEMTITSASTEKNRSIDADSLLVRADGTGRRFGISQYVGKMSYERLEAA